MTEKEIEFVRWCVLDNNVHRFYLWKKWKRKRKEVLSLDKNECQDCKAKSIYTRATMVHHNQYVRKHPDQALEIYYVFEGEKYRNLISLCHDCHELRHGRRMQSKKKDSFQNEERWD